MGNAPNLRLLLLLACRVQALTAPPEGLDVRQYPPSLSVMRGKRATFTCHFRAESLKCGVQWFKTKPERQLIQESSRRIVVVRNWTSSLTITGAALEDSGWYHCVVSVLQKEPEQGNGTELVVLAPPSPPRIYLRVPPDPQTGPWGLLCLTGGFHPNRLHLAWTYRSTAAATRQLSVTSCSLPDLHSHANLSDGGPLSSDWLVNSTPGDAQSRCFQVMDNHSQEVFLFSAVLLPQQQSLDAGITFTCEVRDHPAIAAALTASFTWEAPRNELIAHLNILKLCFLSAAAVLLWLEAAKRLCAP